MLRFLESMQWVLFIFFTAAYAYQIFYLLVGLWGKQRGGVENAELHRYAAIISARNESAVIGRLIDPHLEGAGLSVRAARCHCCCR